MERSELHLGDLIRDTITGFEGVAVHKSEWLNGCVRVGVQPKKLFEGKPVEAQMFDIEQLELVTAVKPATGTKAKAAAAGEHGGDRPAIRRAPDPRR
jgi:hypothetical protein